MAADARLRELSRGDPKSLESQGRLLQELKRTGHRGLWELLHLDTWRQLRADLQDWVAAWLDEALAEFRPAMQLLELSPFGPPGQTVRLPRWRETTTGLTYVLVPGGRFEPGFNPRILAQYRAIVASGRYCTTSEAEAAALGGRPARSVAPALMTTAPLSRAFLEDYGFDGDFMDDVGAPHEGAKYVPWEGVALVLERYGWDLPTPDEFQWAARGGFDVLFPWGPTIRPAIYQQGLPGDEDRYAADCVSGSFPDPLDARWPLANGFGLQGMGGPAHWCRPRRPGGLPVSHGGAAGCYPWQSDGWALAITAMDCEVDPSALYEGPRGIRPVLRLAPLFGELAHAQELDPEQDDQVSEPVKDAVTAPPVDSSDPWRRVKGLFKKWIRLRHEAVGWLELELAEEALAEVIPEPPGAYLRLLPEALLRWYDSWHLSACRLASTVRVLGPRELRVVSDRLVFAEAPESGTSWTIPVADLQTPDPAVDRLQRGGVTRSHERLTEFMTAFLLYALAERGTSTSSESGPCRAEVQRLVLRGQAMCERATRRYSLVPVDDPFGHASFLGDSDTIVRRVSRDLAYVVTRTDAARGQAQSILEA